MVRWKVEDAYFNNIYPVGSIYMSVNDNNPSELFGGEWEQIKDRFLLACGTTYSNGATGGEATHTLTVDEMPSHNHTYLTSPHSWAERDSSQSQIISPSTGAAKKVTKTTNNTGGGRPHNNMPPYLAVYVWVRTK